MSETAAKLTAELLALPESERWAVVGAVVGSLPKPHGGLAEDDPGFDAELDRRLADRLSGRSKGIPAEEFFRTLREGRS